MKLQRLLMLTAALLCMRSAAALDVFACEPEWAALVQELGGERVSLYSATSALQDPHRIEARPSLIAKLRRADLLVCTGAGLEAGWLPMLVRKAANARVQPGRPGHFLAAHQVPLKEAPTQLDRAHGDVHADGNPHIQTDPHNIARVAAVLAERLATIDAAHASEYRERYLEFADAWSKAIAGWERQAAVLRGTPIVVQHRSWVYLSDWLGLVEVATLEPKPGVPPSSGYLAEVLERLRTQPAKLVVRAAYQDRQAAEWLHRQTGLPLVELPFTVGGTEGAQDLYGLFDDSIARLLQAVQ